MTNGTLFEDGIEALKSGDKREARRIFSILVHDNPDDVASWWYLAVALDDSEQQLECLRHVLRLRPSHEKARNMLNRLERRVAWNTPSGGYERPVLDFEEGEDGIHIPTNPHGFHIDRPEAIPPNRKSPFVLLMAGGLAMVGLIIVGLVVLVVTSGLERPPGASNGETDTVVGFDVPKCEVGDSDQARIRFINESGQTLVINWGIVGEEQYLLTLPADGQERVIVDPQVPVRYSIETSAPGRVGGGATIEVAAGNVCSVSIR